MFKLETKVSKIREYFKPLESKSNIMGKLKS